MIDISDGLVQDLGHILNASRKGAFLFEELIPVAPEAEGLNDALFAGEDFELLFTISRHQAKALCRNASFRFMPIGEVTGKAGKIILVGKNGKEKKVPLQGYRHF